MEDAEEKEEDFVVVTGGKLDIDEQLLEILEIEFPTRVLCKEDCKGLCPVCGADLNETTCNCNTKQIDPRLEKLKMLLDS